MRRCLLALGALSLATVLALLAPQSSQAASTLFIRGGGDGHGIGMSQYGAYGYALHGRSYRFILAHYYQGTGLGETDPNRLVRVLLQSGQAAFSGADHTTTGKRLDPGMTYAVQPTANGSLVVLDQSGKRVGRFRAPLVVTGRGPLNVAGLGTYRGGLQFEPDGAGGVQTVNALGLDDYVRGVISAEMPASWAPEALKAQAVAARTYAITTSVGDPSFDLYPDTRSQMYAGVAAETPATDAAVAATRGQIVTYGGAPVVTYFFNSSGGHTEDIENVWPNASPQPWLRGVADPYDDAGGDPYHRWGQEMSAAAAQARLGALVKGELLGIAVTRHGASPRVVSADVLGTAGRTSLTGGELQRLFGLLTTSATFTTISTVPAQLPAVSTTITTTTPVPLPAPAVGMRVFSTIVPVAPQRRSRRVVTTRAVPALAGRVFPTSPRSVAAAQVSTGNGWRTIARVRLGPDGRYRLALLGAGTYRISYQGLNGPAVHIS